MLKFGHNLADECGVIRYMYSPQAFDSTLAVLACDNTGTSDNPASTSDIVGPGIPILGLKSVAFLVCVGALAGGTVAVAVRYASNGKASDAASSTTVWTCSDAVMTITTNSTDGVYGADYPYILDVNIEAKGLSDAAGRLFVTLTAASNAVGVIGVVAIPIPGTAQIPITQARTGNVIADNIT